MANSSDRERCVHAGQQLQLVGHPTGHRPIRRSPPPRPAPAPLPRTSAAGWRASTRTSAPPPTSRRRQIPVAAPRSAAKVRARRRRRVRGFTPNRAAARRPRPKGRAQPPAADARSWRSTTPCRAAHRSTFTTSSSGPLPPRSAAAGSAPSRRSCGSTSRHADVARTSSHKRCLVSSSRFAATARVRRCHGKTGSGTSALKHRRQAPRPPTREPIGQRARPAPEQMQHHQRGIRVITAVPGRPPQQRAEHRVRPVPVRSRGQRPRQRPHRRPTAQHRLADPHRAIAAAASSRSVSSGQDPTGQSSSSATAPPAELGSTRRTLPAAVSHGQHRCQRTRR